jgi:uroporphyrinogen-III decarboxylase
MKLSPKKRAFKALLGSKTDRAPVTTFTGCGIPPETPTANIKAMVEAVKTYGRQIKSV